MTKSARRARILAAGLAVAIAGLSLSACKEVESEEASGYEPAKLEEISENLKRVTFTQEGADRVGLETAKVSRRDGRKAVPHAALIYDAEGHTYVYTSPKPLTYLRKEVKVDRVEGDWALVSKGPRAGTDVVTTGAAEVYGTELEVASH